MVLAVFGLEPVYVASTNITGFNVGDIVVSILSSSRVVIAIGVEVLLSAALGYVMAKMVRYILAFIALLVIGAILNVWSLGGSVEDFLMRLKGAAGQLKGIVLDFISTLGLLMAGPVTLGFFIGLITGLLRK